jgi:hypothetical protein
MRFVFTSAATELKVERMGSWATTAWVISFREIAGEADEPAELNLVLLSRRWSQIPSIDGGASKDHG